MPSELRVRLVEVVGESVADDREAAEDDEAKPDVGKNAATKLAGDDAVVGVVVARCSSRRRASNRR